MTNLHHLFSSFLDFAEITFPKIFFLTYVSGDKIENQDNYLYIAEIKSASEPKATYVISTYSNISFSNGLCLHLQH